MNNTEWDNEERLRFCGKRVGDIVDAKTNGLDQRGEVTWYGADDAAIYVLWDGKLEPARVDAAAVNILEKVEDRPVDRKPNIYDQLMSAVIERRFYNPYNVFHHPPTFSEEAAGSRYRYKADIIKWNTRSTRLISVGLSWNEREQRWVAATYKTGSIKRTPRGEKMR
jgi:hypothetical protein